MLIPFKELFAKYKIRSKGAFHVGASYGQEVEEYYKNGIEHTVWIEALRNVYSQLLLNLMPYKDAIAINECVSDVNGKEVLFNVANNEGQSSSILEFGTHIKEHPTVKFVNRIKMETIRLDTLIKKYRLDMSKYDFLNIDLQGAELMALKGLGDYLNGFRYLYLEVNRAELYKECPMVEELDEYVKPFGFERVETKWTNFGWGDCLMIKR
jgi:FkbM family methyltransferase